MKKVALILAITAISVTHDALAASTIWMSKVPDTPWTDGWVITAISVDSVHAIMDTPAVWKMGNILRVTTDPTGPTSGLLTCSKTMTADCYQWKPPPATPPCDTNLATAQHAQQLVGLGVTTKKGERPYNWSYYCVDRAGTNTTRSIPAGTVIATDAPVSCTIANAQLTFRGRVGERAKTSTNLNIQCDSPATLRLTLSDGGLVRVGGEGEVRLTFGKNGRDVLDVSGTAPLVDIEGELTKSPPTAGTYSGSSVLRLDIL